MAGVFSAHAGGDVLRRTYVAALLPLAAIPVLIAATAVRIPGTLPLLAASPFLAGAWIGVSFWRGGEPKRQVWLYAFTEGFMLLDGPWAGAMPVTWSQVTEVGQVWTNTYRPGDDDPRPALAAYRLRSADGHPPSTRSSQCTRGRQAGTREARQLTSDWPGRSESDGA